MFIDTHEYIFDMRYAHEYDDEWIWIAELVNWAAAYHES